MPSGVLAASELAAGHHPAHSTVDFVERAVPARPVQRPRTALSSVKMRTVTTVNYRQRQ
jgi:hypothetical protein